jgi:hypothetical protein
MKKKKRILPMNKAEESWHLSKSVPITFILAIALQTFGVIWYMSNLDSNVELNARDIARHEIRINEMEKQTQELKVLNARIDENIKAIREMMEKSRAN